MKNDEQRLTQGALRQLERWNTPTIYNGGAPDAVSGRVSIVRADACAAALSAPPLAAERHAIFVPAETDPLYNHHVQIVRHKGKFFAGWSAGAVNEDSPGQHVVWSESDDGATWSPPRAVMPPPEGKTRWTMGGFWEEGGRLHLLACRCGRTSYVDGECRPHVLWEDLATELFVLESEGSWRSLGLWVENLYPNEPPQRLDSGEWLAPGVNALAEVVVALGGAPGSGRARLVNVTHKMDGFNRRGTKLTEPTCWRMGEGVYRMLLRDDAGSRWLWLTETADNGATWSEPVPTDFPDAVSKLRAQMLNDGRVALVSNPARDGLRRRWLAVALSEDGGRTFSEMRTIRHDPDIRPRYDGLHKVAGFDYPSTLVLDDALWVAYSVNKEDIVIERMAF